MVRGFESYTLFFVSVADLVQAMDCKSIELGSIPSIDSKIVPPIQGRWSLATGGGLLIVVQKKHGEKSWHMKEMGLALEQSF